MSQRSSTMAKPVVSTLCRFTSRIVFVPSRLASGPSRFGIYCLSFVRTVVWRFCRHATANEKASLSSFHVLMSVYNKSQPGIADPLFQSQEVCLCAPPVSSPSPTHDGGIDCVTAARRLTLTCSHPPCTIRPNGQSSLVK